MAAKRQIQDSRRNVALSNGPDRPQRKTNSSTNAITHGPWVPQTPFRDPAAISRHPHGNLPPTTTARKIEKLTKQTQSHFREKPV
jgi:hypothetical protein